jgi:DNA-directed RNA polymerase subunit beta'
LKLKSFKLQIIAAIMVLVCLLTLAACGGKKEEEVSPPPSTSPAAQTPKPMPSPSPSPASPPAANTPARPVDDRNDDSPFLDQYYLNDMLMIEMLVNDDVNIQEFDGGLFINTDSEKTMMLIMFKPGLQNLAASGQIARTAVSQSFQDAKVGDLQDGSLFGSRAKYCEFVSVSDEGIPVYGIAAATIANQSFYNVLVAFEEDAPEYEMQLIISVFETINILKPSNVNQNAQTAAYQSQYQAQLNSNQVTPSPASSAKKSVDQWNSLPYEFYSWWGDPGDYGAYPAWCYEPDWDYYSDPGDYWDWGWDDGGDWWFYDEYGDYYDFDYYQDFDDYWDDYDPWSDPGDWDYDPWSDFGDWDDWDYDDWSDPGDWDYDPWSDPGDDWDDYDDWSDYGDDEWSDYGDYDDDW